MIIKSMSRKDNSFGQLIQYMSDIDKADEQYNVYQNLYSRKPEAMEAEFLANAALMAKRKNGNQMYHEILSIKKAQKLDSKTQKQILRSIAYEYAQKRAGENLMFGTLHDDHDDHLHYHLLMSANACNERKRTRLSKQTFDQLKKTMENQVLKQYPELEQTVVINRKAEEKLSNKGGERKRRTGKLPERDAVKQTLDSIFAQCKSKEAFFRAMSDQGLHLYTRGNAIGVKQSSTDRNYRLETLGLMPSFQAMSKHISLEEKQIPKQERKSRRQDKSKKSSSKKRKQ